MTAIDILKRAKRKAVSWLSRAKARREAALAFRYDRAQFMANAGALHLDRRAAACAEIVMGYHILEKGLTMPNRRLGFGKGAVVPDYSIVGRGSFLNKDFGDVKTRGNVFVGSPAALRATGCYRLLDIPLEIRVSKEFKNSDREWMTPEELGVDVEKALNPPPHRGMA